MGSGNVGTILLGIHIGLLERKGTRLGSRIRQGNLHLGLNL